MTVDGCIVRMGCSKLYNFVRVVRGGTPSSASSRRDADILARHPSERIGLTCDFVPWLWLVAGFLVAWGISLASWRTPRSSCRWHNFAPSRSLGTRTARQKLPARGQKVSSRDAG
jgi:hypothetical protein